MSARVSTAPAAPRPLAALIAAPIERAPLAAAALAVSAVAAIEDVPAPTVVEAPLAPDATDPTIVQLIDDLMATPMPAKRLADVLVPAAVAQKSGARRASDPLQYWGLREPAFDNAPSTRFLYLSPAHAEALFRLRYAIQHCKGCAMLTGTYGCGKTTLTRALARDLDPARYDVALIANPMSTPETLLRELLYQLGVQTRADDRTELRRLLEARLLENVRRNRDTVVILDEAQLIDDAAVFNELRLLLNFQMNDRCLLTLVLSGSDELIPTLRRQPHLAQRCVVRASVEPLDRDQTAHYVRHCLVTAGRRAETLTEAALDELYAVTRGVPRVINAVCDLTLFVGAAAGVTEVDADLIRRVAGDITVPA